MNNAQQNISDLLKEHKLDDASAWTSRIDSVTAGQVEKELAQPAGLFSLDRLTTLVSPQAANYLEQMAQLAKRLTIQRFGKTIQLYAPLYVSNHCVNNCLYCGYNASSKFARTRLSIEEAMRDADAIAAEGFRHILIVSGEDRRFVTVDYLVELAGRLREKFSSISIEIFQLESDEYAALAAAGIDGLTLYQETFDRDVYQRLHHGPKADYDRRLHAHEHAAAAGFRRLGLGALLGLGDWRHETLALGMHAQYLMRRYWRAAVAFSFPRMRPANDVSFSPKNIPSDADLVQMILALRLCFSDAAMYLSTRESPDLRDNCIGLGITSISAGSKTNPGGYASHTEAVGQFEVSDDRSPAQIARMLCCKGYEVVWKDWDRAFTGC